MTKKHKNKKSKKPQKLLPILLVIASFNILVFYICSGILVYQTANQPKAITTLSDKPHSTIIYKQLANASYYNNWMNNAVHYFDAVGVVKDSISENDITTLAESLSKIAHPYYESAEETFNTIKSEYDAMVNARNATNSLFASADHTKVRPNVIRAEYNDAKVKIDSLKQENLKNELLKSLEPVLPVIEEQERIARERAEALRRAREEEQRKIAASWHRLNLSPYYINQFSAGFANGCEAASVLMSAKYKGRMMGHSLGSFADTIQITDDPNTGFYLSMTESRNGGPAHWIAPAPLASFANAQGAGIVNVSGASLDQLDNEVKNGNPVIIYLTYRYANPVGYHNGVPDNLHVVVLSGYNAYTGEQVFTDPAISGQASLSKSRTEYLYNASGRRALVVK